jgi:hypothetical protein
MGTPAPSAAAQELVNVPSMLIIVLGGLGVLLSLLGIVGSLGGSNDFAMQLVKALPPEQQAKFGQMLASSRGGSGIFQNIIGIACAAFTVYGGMQMRALKNWGLALAATILAMLPCGSSCCCCLGLPIGIWVIITLTKPEVKSAFT